MAWAYLLLAGLFEVVWATTLKYSEGFTKPLYTIITAIGMIISFALLSMAMKTLPLGTSYAIWTGIGAVGAFIVGIIWLGEAATFFRIISVSLIALGIIGLKLSSNH